MKVPLYGGPLDGDEREIGTKAAVTLDIVHTTATTTPERVRYVLTRHPSTGTLVYVLGAIVDRSRKTNTEDAS